jgi:hypothetical protein
MRLVTRADLDGLACAVLITASEKIDDILLVHPQDITDKKVAITPDDILANLPYHGSCGKWFDHHILTESNERPPERFDGRYGLAPSAARVVFEYYIEKNPFLKKYESFIGETDRLDAAQLDLDDVLNPEGVILRGYTLDPRTGLGAYQDYFKKLVEWLHAKPIGEILELPEVEERVKRMREQDEAFRAATTANSRLDGNVVVTDFRGLPAIPVGNRFLVYTLFPSANISMRIHWGPGRVHVSVAVGHSIFNRTSRTSVGNLMSRFGGGGHKGAGHCLLPVDTAEEKIAEILAAMKKDG